MPSLTTAAAIVVMARHTSLHTSDDGRSPCVRQHLAPTPPLPPTAAPRCSISAADDAATAADAAAPRGCPAAAGPPSWRKRNTTTFPNKEGERPSSHSHRRRRLLPRGRAAFPPSLSHTQSFRHCAQSSSSVQGSGNCLRSRKAAHLACFGTHASKAPLSPSSASGERERERRREMKPRQQRQLAAHLLNKLIDGTKRQPASRRTKLTH